MEEPRVYRLNRWNAVYESGSRRVTVPVEASADGAILMVYVNDVASWDSPAEGVALSAEDRLEIGKRFTEEYRKQGVAVEIDPAQ